MYLIGFVIFAVNMLCGSVLAVVLLLFLLVVGVRVCYGGEADEVISHMDCAAGEVSIAGG
jgi:hypothetical protein